MVGSPGPTSLSLFNCCKTRPTSDLSWKSAVYMQMTLSLRKSSNCDLGFTLAAIPSSFCAVALATKPQISLTSEGEQKSIHWENGPNTILVLAQGREIWMRHATFSLLTMAYIPCRFEPCPLGLGGEYRPQLDSVLVITLASKMWSICLTAPTFA